MKAAWQRPPGGWVLAALLLARTGEAQEFTMSLSTRPQGQTVALSVSAQEEAQEESVLVIQGAHIKGAMIPIYLPKEKKTALVLRAEKISPDYERKLFFRIGVLPLPVAEGVRLEFSDSGRLTNALTKLHRLLGAVDRSRRSELRKVKFIFAPETAPRLEAGRVRLEHDGQWRLLDGVSFRVGTNEIKVAQARLQVAGPDVGELTWRSAGTTNVFHLFAPCPENRVSTANPARK